MSSTVGIGITIGVWLPLAVNSRVAQWKRAGPITQRSVDRNYALLIIFVFQLTQRDQLYFIPGCQFVSVAVPLAQRIARWTSNPKVLGSIPRWDEFFLRPRQHFMLLPLSFLSVHTHKVAGPCPKFNYRMDFHPSSTCKVLWCNG